MTTGPPVLKLRLPLPKTVVTIRVPNDVVHVLRDVLNRSILHVRVTMAEAEVILLDALDACVVASVPSDIEVDECLQLIRLRGLFPQVPMVALYFPSRSSCLAVLQLGAVGVNQIVTVEPHPRANDLAVAMSRSHADGVAVRLWRQSGLDLPDPVVPVLKAAIRLAHGPLTAATLGDAVGLPQRSLRRYCAQHRLPSPQWLIGWARLLVAGYYLDDPGRNLVQVAKILQFASPCALRNQLKRYCHLPSRALRVGGTTATVARALEKVLAAGAVTVLAPVRQRSMR